MTGGPPEDPEVPDEVPEPGPDAVHDDVVHDALVELNQLRVAMRMDPVEHPVEPGPDDGTG